ncbi:hypothetical protein RvY_05132-1 [Ramazzottius varieornatus]|uniref:Receptor ligand binding region domain-containing protein n=1 Tax=Ramazzottius varieornatus TaxID=947166 RepID=A0A1D1UU27_RAMVA|nr:hypothetical protein RvY_05132-1 [Ramazzottius varieornatus]
MYRVRQILVTAQKLGFVNGDFVYIAAWPYEHAQYGNLSWQYADVDDEVAKLAFGSLLVITPKVTPTELRIRDMYKDVLPKSQKNPMILATYLSFIATAKVIASAWTSGKDVKNATAMVRDLRSPSYDQEPIMLLLKAALYSIRMFDRVSSSLREVFSYNPSNKDWEPTPGVVPKWPGPTNEPPSDEPFCGFMNEKPWCHQSRSSSPEIALIISILVILVFSVISFATFR